LGLDNLVAGGLTDDLGGADRATVHIALFLTALGGDRRFAARARAGVQAVEQQSGDLAFLDVVQRLLVRLPLSPRGPVGPVELVPLLVGIGNLAGEPTGGVREVGQRRSGRLLDESVEFSLCSRERLLGS